MLIAIAYPGMVDQAQDEVRAVLRIERRVPFNAPGQFLHDHGGADDRSISTA